ncbi:MAG: CobW family GTP-binding protein [bacterium]|jgi:G3E family GTPase|nr:GTP-binding protein [Betaproteobacteria bacterium]
MATRCNLITGFLGAGKTTLIRHLLAQRPAGERWAVIVNEFGVVGIDGTTLAAADAAAPDRARVHVEIREVAGGCICCAANVPLRVAITDVLRRVRPDRLLVEPSGLGHPAAILATLAEPGLAKALTVGAVVCVADPGRPLPGAGSTDPLDDTWHDQLAMADVVVGNKRDRVDGAAWQAFADYAAALYPPKQAIVPTVEGRIPATLLDVPRARWRPLLAGGHHADGAVDAATACPVPGLGTRHAARSAGAASLGWLFDDPHRMQAAFDADLIDRLMVRLAATVDACGARLLRAKAALRTDHGNRLVEWSAGQVRSSPLAFDGPSRFELLFDGGDPQSGDRIAAAIEPLLQPAL